MPALELDDVALGIGHVDHGQFSRARNIQRHELADVTSAQTEQFLPLGRDVRHFEGEMRKSRPNEPRWQAGIILIRLKNFQGRAAFAVAGQTQMTALEGSAGQSSQRFESWTLVVAFRADRFAAERLDVEILEALPVVRDEVGVGVPDSGGCSGHEEILAGLLRSGGGDADSGEGRWEVFYFLAQLPTRAFHGIFEISIPSPHQSVAPAKIKPAPTKADNQMNAGFTKCESSPPLRTKAPAAMRT